jgi:hypothetical protein
MAIAITPCRGPSPRNLLAALDSRSRFRAMLSKPHTQGNAMTAATIDLASLADALEADIIPYRTPSGTLLVSIDGGETAIGPTGKRVPVRSAWDEADDEIAVDVLATPQIDALAALAEMRETARKRRAERIAADERRARRNAEWDAMSPYERYHARSGGRTPRESSRDELVSLYQDTLAILRLLGATRR